MSRASKRWIWIAAFGLDRVPGSSLALASQTEGGKTVTRPCVDFFDLKTLHVVSESNDGRSAPTASSGRSLSDISGDMVTLANLTGKTVVATYTDEEPTLV